VRHEESNILEYLSDEQRHWRRCSGGRMPWLFRGGPLGLASHVTLHGLNHHFIVSFAQKGRDAMGECNRAVTPARATKSDCKVAFALQLIQRNEKSQHSHSVIDELPSRLLLQHVSLHSFVQTGEVTQT